MTNKHILLNAVLACFATLSISAQTRGIYVSDAGNFNQPPWQILKFDSNGENGQVFIDDHLAWPQDIVFLEDKNIVLISNLNTGEILRFDATTGDFLNAFATGIGGPTRMKIGSDSLLYVLQWSGNGTVRRYTLDGTYVDEFTNAGIVTSIGLDWDGEGNLYVSSYNGKFIQKFDPSGEDLGKFISSNLQGPTNIWFDDSGDLLVNDYNGGAVKRFDKDGNYKGVFISNTPQAEGVDFLPDGSILLGIGGTSSVRKYDASGNLINTIVPPNTLNLKTPNAVVIRQNQITSVDSPMQIFKEMNIVTPSTGTSFKFSNIPDIVSGTMAEISNNAGAVIRKMNVSDSTYVNATSLSDGIYMITVRLQNNTIARQRIIVQH